MKNALFIGGPLDLHRIALPELNPVYYAPVLDRPAFADVGYPSAEPVQVKNAQYRLFELPNPNPLMYPHRIPLYLFAGTK